MRQFRREHLSKWYTTIVVGKIELNQIVTFEFKNLASFKFKIINLVQDKSIHFEIVESEWGNKGHIMKYDLDKNDGKTRVRYTYEGFKDIDDAFANMNYSSAKYLESLRQFVKRNRRSLWLRKLSILKFECFPKVF